MVDLNVILDVIQNRIPHYEASAQILSGVRIGKFAGVIPGHAITTIHYIIAKSSAAEKANQTIDWLLQHFEVSGAEKSTLQRARQISLPDFEDAVVASCAEATHSNYIVTHNVADFSGSPVRAITPSEFLELETH